MGNLNGYNAEGGDTMDTRDTLPVGEYVASIVKSDRQESRNKPGNAYLNVEFEVMEGECEGRHFWTMLNLWNSNAQAAEIAQRELNSICHAVGKLRVDDSSELHGIPMRVTLKVEADDKYGPQNRVKGYKPLNGEAPTAATTRQTSTGGGTSNGAAASRPWNQPSA